MRINDPARLPALTKDAGATGAKETVLSEREAEVLVFLKDGLSSRAIGSKMNISENTVKWHLKNLFDKLDVKNRTSAVMTAHKLGLL